jgi:hypothetical protein
MKHFITEFLIVVAGILVALAVDQWRQDREELRILKESLADVAMEVHGNISTIERIRDKAMIRKMQGLETAIRFLSDPDGKANDPDALLQAFAFSASGATPWLVDDRFQALRNSGNLRLLRNDELAGHLTTAYEGPHVLFAQIDRIQGTYPTVVNEMLPASLQSTVNSTRWYARGATAPVIHDSATAAGAVEEIRGRRLELLRLARAESAVATGKWYALERTNHDLHELLTSLAPWDPQAAMAPAPAKRTP